MVISALRVSRPPASPGQLRATQRVSPLTSYVPSASASSPVLGAVGPIVVVIFPSAVSVAAAVPQGGIAFPSDRPNRHVPTSFAARGFFGTGAAGATDRRAAGTSRPARRRGIATT